MKGEGEEGGGEEEESAGGKWKKACWMLALAGHQALVEVGSWKLDGLRLLSRQLRTEKKKRRQQPTARPFRVSRLRMIPFMPLRTLPPYVVKIQFGAAG